MKQPDYSWAEYLDCMEGGSDVISLPAARPVDAKKQTPAWGLCLALGLTVSALWLSVLPVWPFTLAAGRHPIEPVMLAIILGMMVSNLWTIPRACQAGIKFAVKKVLPVGIILLGVQLDFFMLLNVGLTGLCLSVLETVVALGLLLYLTKKMGLPGKLGILLGVGTGICGGTAIVATAPVIEADEKDVVFSVATVTLLGLVAMFVLPVAGHWLGLSDQAFGIWAGLAIHQTPQVVAAGFAYSAEAGSVATIAKLARVCLLAPVVFFVGLMYARSKEAASGSFHRKKRDYLQLFPMFVLGFLAMALLQTFKFIPDLTVHLKDAKWFGNPVFEVSLTHVAQQVSMFCIVISMAGVGLETKFSSMKQTGLKPFLASLIAALTIALLILGLIRVLGL